MPRVPSIFPALFHECPGAKQQTGPNEQSGGGRVGIKAVVQGGADERFGRIEEG